MLNHSSEHAVAARGSVPIWSARGEGENLRSITKQGKRSWIGGFDPLPVSQYKDQSDAKIGWRPVLYWSVLVTR